MKKWFLILVFLPLMAFNQAKFATEEYFYIDRAADSTHEKAYCAWCFDSLYTRWGGATGLDTFRVYVDSVALFMQSEADSSKFTIYNQYGYAETALKTDIWAYTVGAKLMYNIRQYSLSPGNKRVPYRDDFIRYCSGRVYIRHFKP